MNLLYYFHITFWQREEMFALRRSNENELKRNFLPARFASRVQQRLVVLTICQNNPVGTSVDYL